MRPSARASALGIGIGATLSALACGTPTVQGHDACAERYADMAGTQGVEIAPAAAEFEPYDQLRIGDTLRLGAALRRIRYVYDSDPNNLWRPIDLTAFGSCRILWGEVVAGAIEWSSSVPSVASVASGVVVGRSEGQTVITARSGAAAGTRTVRVIASP